MLIELTEWEINRIHRALWRYCRDRPDEENKNINYNKIEDIYYKLYPYTTVEDGLAT
jgi:hypothetical protein